MKFTKEEINLCKQVAEKDRKSFKYGDWYYFKEKVHLIWAKPEPIMDDICIPLWTIFDCLEFLREKGWNVLHLSEEKSGWYTKIITYDESITPYVHIADGKTPLIACPKAVLAVLEEK